MAFALYDHQLKIISELIAKLDAGEKNLLVVSPAGSGKSVMIAALVSWRVRHGDQVLFMVHRKELCEQIQQTFEYEGIDMNHVTIISVQSLVHRFDSTPTPDWIITDETHHAKAKTYVKVYQHWPNAKRLGFTATPTRLSGEGFEDIYDDLVEGQSVEWLIEHQYLAPFKYFSLPLLDRKKLHKSKGEFTNASITAALNGDTIFGEVIKTYQEKASGRQAILYAHNVAYSKQLEKKFNQAGIVAKHIDAKTPKQERDQIMNDFRTKNITVLCNVDLVSEGFDVPECSTVILLRPTQSLTLFVQQAMRGMRYKPDKTAIIIDHVGNYLKHGLPDTNRMWTLEGGEQKTPQLQQCPKCKAMFSQWRTGTNKQGIYKTCPVCGYTEVRPSAEEKPEVNTMITAEAELQEITPEEKQLLAIRQIAKRNHVRFKRRLLNIVEIFCARNQVAKADHKKPTYNFPVRFAIRQYLKLNTVAQQQRGKSQLDLDIKTISDTFGEETGMNVQRIRYYIQKVRRENSQNVE